MSARRAVTVVGIGDDGCASLSSRAASAVARAEVLVGGERHLEFFPQFRGEKIALKGGLSAALDRVDALSAEQNVCILASGDPLFFGVGALVVRKLGGEHVEIIPSLSSVQWAFARTGIAWDDAAFVSVHGRSPEGFATRLRRLSKVAVLTDGENSPARLAARLLEHGDAGWKAWVCESLAGAGERVRAFDLAALAACEDIGPLNVLLLLRSDPAWRPPPAIPYLHEDAFAKRMPKNGLITKREVRMLSIASMAIRPDAVVWDVGAGSGSVSIEAAMLCPLGRVHAIEVDPEGVEICRDNVRTHGVDNVRVVAGRAPEALAALEDPDAVFVGGSKGSMEEIVTVALDRLRPGGRLVVNAITMENVAETYRALRARGLDPEVTLLSVSRGVPLARYVRYEALNPIHIFAATKPANAEEAVEGAAPTQPAAGGAPRSTSEAS
ncbi:precorrin-6y C5,15-methyltransferase (decarboxylating) subunit CbiE [Sorangium sp. So ce1504]|uniref:precorrin-6y C5,15-methyltransferase (decarboxylating) subunit CbiE n=1 Tax=Sorangium sp. So ce1504 TaxID=3133337 RepID=UPI003F5F7DF3